MNPLAVPTPVGSIPPLIAAGPRLVELLIQYIDSVIPAVGGIAVIVAGLRPVTGWCPAGEAEMREARRRRLLRLGVMLLAVSVIYLGVSFRRVTPIKAGPPPQEWSPLIEGGRFSVLLPAHRTHTQSDERSALGLIRSHKWKAGADPDNLAYVFRYKDLPSGSVYTDPAATLDEMVKALKQTPGSKVLRTERISVDGFPGVRIEGELNGVPQETRAIVTRTRLYILVRAAKENAAPADDPFFDSFSLAGL